MVSIAPVIFADRLPLLANLIAGDIQEPDLLLFILSLVVKTSVPLWVSFTAVPCVLSYCNFKMKAWTKEKTYLNLFRPDNEYLLYNAYGLARI